MFTRSVRNAEHWVHKQSILRRFFSFICIFHSRCGICDEHWRTDAAFSSRHVPVNDHSILIHLRIWRATSWRCASSLTLRHTARVPFVTHIFVLCFEMNGVSQLIKNLFPLQDRGFYILRRILVYKLTVSSGHWLLEDKLIMLLVKPFVLISTCISVLEKLIFAKRFFRALWSDTTHIFLWRCYPTRVMASSFLRFLDHTHRRTIVGRAPLDEWSARRRDLYLTTHNTRNRQTSMPPVGFEPTISAGEQPQNYVLDRAATGFDGLVIRVL